MSLWADWRIRHQHPVSLGLHAIGIPLTVAAVILAVAQLLDWRWDLWWRPTVLLVGGYLLQWVGHRLEGNTMGELILVNKMLGRPYRAVGPKFQNRDFSDSTTDSDASRGLG